MLGLFAFAIALNPIGFIGGDADDLQYLEAARCWRDFGPCLPLDHWQGRWPIVAPLALAITMFGETRWSVALPPLAASIACLLLVFCLGRQLFSDRAGAVAACLLAVTPTFAIQALDPNIDVFELAFILGGFAALLQGRQDGRLVWPILCGFSFGLALQCRETALAVAPAALIAFAYVHPLRRRSAWLAAAVGFALPFLIEAMIFALEAGDPFWRRKLSLQHTGLRTTELRGRTSVQGPPFFNRELIANWRHEPGLALHWSIDGLANLFVNPRTAGVYLLFPLLLVQAGKSLTSFERRRVTWMMAAGLTHASVLIYVFAIDPKPRMMLVPLIATGLACAPLFNALGRRRPRAAAMLAAGVIGICGTNILSGYRSDVGEAVAREWIRHHGNEAETVRQTRRRMVFIPESRRLASFGSGRPLLMVQVNNSCSGWLTELGVDQKLVVVARERALGTYPASWVPRQAHLCLFKYTDDRARGALANALGPTETGGR